MVLFGYMLVVVCTIGEDKNNLPVFTLVSMQRFEGQGGKVFGWIGSIGLQFPQNLPKIFPVER